MTYTVRKAPPKTVTNKVVEADCRAQRGKHVQVWVLPLDVGSRGHRIWIERGLQVGDPTDRKWRELPVELEGKLMIDRVTNKNEWVLQ